MLFQVLFHIKSIPAALPKLCVHAARRKKFKKGMGNIRSEALFPFLSPLTAGGGTGGVSGKTGEKGFLGNCLLPNRWKKSIVYL